MNSILEDALENISAYEILREFRENMEHGIGRKHWALIPANQYHNLLKRYMSMGDAARIPESTVRSWFRIIINNTVTLSCLTSLYGHSSYFPIEDVLEVFEDVDIDDYHTASEFLDEQGFYKWAVLPDGTWACSDYGLEPLFQIFNEYNDNSTPEETLILINRCLDVGHYRGDLASAFIEGGSRACSRISNENKNYTFKNMINEVAAKYKFVTGPEEFYDILAGIPNGRFVTFGYVSAAKVVVPKGKRLNPKTNRMNQFDDYEALGNELGVNGVVTGVIKLSVYNFPWQTEEKVNSAYQSFKNDRDNLASKYGVEVGSARYKTNTMNFGPGVKGYGGNNAELRGHTYTNINMYGIKAREVHYYLTFDDGHLEEIEKERLQFLPPTVKDTIIDKLKNAGATPEEVEPLTKMNYVRFEHSHLLFFSATSDGIPTVMINTHLSDKIAGITLVDTNEIINLAKERYSKFIPESKRRNDSKVITESVLREIIAESIRKVLRETELDYDEDNFSGRYNYPEHYNIYIGDDIEYHNVPEDEVDELYRRAERKAEMWGEKVTVKEA